MVLLAGVCLSSGGLIVRLMEAADGWQILFYRSIASEARLETGATPAWFR